MELAIFAEQGAMALKGVRTAHVVIDATGVPRKVAEHTIWHGNEDVSFSCALPTSALNHPITLRTPRSDEHNQQFFLDRVARRDIQLDALIPQRIVPGEPGVIYRSLTDSFTQTLGVVVDWTKIGECNT